MITFRILIIVGALLCFGLAAAGVPSRVGLVPLGLFLLTLLLVL
jgi:hypothetical protein